MICFSFAFLHFYPSILCSKCSFAILLHFGCHSAGKQTDIKQQKDSQNTHIKQFPIEKMSIYSGFATRQQQETYDHCLNSLLYILQKRILKFYANEKTDEYKFTSLVQKMYLQMRQMQKSKYLDPKSSFSFQQLYDYLIKQNQTDNNATIEIDSYNNNSNKKNVQKKAINNDQRSIGNSNNIEVSHKRKSYQIPIRSQKTSPEKRKQRIRNSTMVMMENVGKIVTTKSKQKKQAMTIQYSSNNMIRKRTPLTTGNNQVGQRLQAKTAHNQSQQRQFVSRRQRNISFANPNDQLIKHRNSSTNVVRFTNQLQNDLLLQNEIAEIIQGYMGRNTREKVTSRNHSKGWLNRSGSKERSLFVSKG